MQLHETIRRRAMVRSFAPDPVDPAVVDTLLRAALQAPSAGNTGGTCWVVLEGADQTSAYWDATTDEAWRASSARWPGLQRAPVLLLSYSSPRAYVSRYAEPDKAGHVPQPGNGPESGSGSRSGSRSGTVSRSEAENLAIAGSVDSDDDAVSRRSGPELGRGTDEWPVPYWTGDAAFGVMTVLLAVVDAGLGACILGNFRGEAALAQRLAVPDQWRLFCALAVGHPDGNDHRSPSLSRPQPSPEARIHRGSW